jgi:salicylate hydroxylase
MLPYLAQGANSSLEDGYVLGSLLAAVSGKDKNQLSEALKLYEQLRKRRGEAIVRETFAQRNDFHLMDGEEQQARDKLFEGELGKDEPEVKFPSRW